MAWALQRTEKEKPAAGKTDYWRDFCQAGTKKMDLRF